MITIYQNGSKLIKNIFIIIAIWTSFATVAHAQIKYQISNPASVKIALRLALSPQEHSHGLSGIKPSDFPENDGMLFVNDRMGTRRFWMPDTYFNLDIIFLDQNLKIVGIEKSAPSHPGMMEPPAIYRTRTYQAQFILETKADAVFSKALKVGDQLKWLGPSTLSEIVLKTHPKQ